MPLKCQSNNQSAFLTVDQCLSPDWHRCENGGTCIPAENDASCACAGGYTGDFCEIDINECDPNPCLHGQCTDGVNTFTCSCETGM